MKTVIYLIPVLVLTVTLLIRAEFAGKKRQIYLLKPISTLIVILVLVVSFQEATLNFTYSAGVLLGLVFSMAGDIALMFSENRRYFLIGLVMFLLAHIIYTVVFALLGISSAWVLFTGIALFILGLRFYRLIQSNLETMKFPVIAYMLIISLMVNQAFSTLASPVFNKLQAVMIITGAILFYLSDIILAVNRFWKPWRYHRLSLAAYYCGQLLIALAASYFV